MAKMGAHHLFPFPKLLLAYLIFSFTALLFACLGQAATVAKLQSQEVNALKEIAKKLGKKDWDFGSDPCKGEGKWRVMVTGMKSFESSVTCDCSFNNNSSCHIVSIALKAQNLSGTLPPEFSDLQYLKVLDLSRNLLTDTVPSQWATMHLEDLLSGPFPKVLTALLKKNILVIGPVPGQKYSEITFPILSPDPATNKDAHFLKYTTLRNLSIEGNLFSGRIPPEIGKLVKLESSFYRQILSPENCHQH